VNGLQIRNYSEDKEKNFFPFDSLGQEPVLENGFQPKGHFDRMLYLERKRTERSRRPFLLLLLNLEDLLASPGIKP